MGKMKETLLNTPATPPATVRPSSSIISTGESNPWLEYGQAAGANTIVGDLLKFNKGDYLAGKEGYEVALGTELIAQMETLEVGWLKWVDGRPTDRKMGRIAADFKPSRRNELGDSDQELWDADDDGEPKDPWQFTNNLVLADADDGSLYTFTTATKGGLNAIAELCKAYGQAMRQRPDEWPVITLGGSSYPHPDKRIGRVKIPVFEITGWAPKDGSAPAPAAPSTPPPAPTGKTAASQKPSF